MSKQEEKVTKIWVGVEDLKQDAKFLQQQEQEFPEEVAVSTETTEEKRGHSRRDFLKYVGFGLGAATIAGCEAPLKKALPYVVKPENIVPGVATYYASVYVKGGDCVPVIVKTREGRPIKIEGNPQASLTKTAKGAGTNSRVQASVLELYDTNRLKSAGKVNGDKVEEISWLDLDKEISQKLNANSNIRIVSHTTVSPTLLKAIEAFKQKYTRAVHVQYDPFSCSALIDAHKALGKGAAVPNFRFDKAMCVVGINADFLGTWISPLEYSRDYIKNRAIGDESIKNASKAMSFHVQMESGMSMTGSNADHRVLIKPSEQLAAIAYLYNCVMGNTGGAPAFKWGRAAELIQKTAQRLLASKGSALVVCGVNDINAQMVVAAINEALGAYGTTIDTTRPSYQRKGNDAALQTLVSELGSVDAVFILDANPAYDIPGLAGKFADGLKNVGLSVCMNGTLDETAALCKYVAPDHHYLESWGDAEPKAGMYYLQQPTIKPLFNTRAAGLSFMTWGGYMGSLVVQDIPTTDSTAPAPVPLVTVSNSDPYYDFLKRFWELNIFPKQTQYATFQAFWDNSLREGLFEMEGGVSIPQPTEQPTLDSTSVVTSVPNVSAALGNMSIKDGGDLEVSFYESVHMGSGQHQNNPWLQELPDPVTRITWDNFIAIPIKWNGDNDYISLNDLKDGDIASVTINGNTYKLPVFRQFGQLDGTISIALGYGRTRAGKAGNMVGVNLFPEAGINKMWASASGMQNEGHDNLFACVQMHHTYGLKNKNEKGEIINVDEQVLGHRGFQGSLTNRSVFFEGNAADLEKSVTKLKKKREGYQYLNSKGLYPSRNEIYGLGHHWAMAIDLNACIGCGACAVACMAENNVPVVGKYEVAKIHEMAWMRIDRYFYGEEETPHAAYMPMMCQHCDNAPCENVCPVNATNHSSEGLNQMAYNRCIGTRYCANNCPYKVRRFNWLDYTSADMFPSNEVDVNRGKEGAEYYTYMTDALTRMVLNPDVTVRSRGVIEKCSFCVQRIQEGKLKAKVEGRPLEDGDVVSACMQACPTGAIVFGDRNDTNSLVHKQMYSQRSYLALEEVNVRSSVFYLMKVMNRDANFNALQATNNAPSTTTEDHHS